MAIWSKLLPELEARVLCFLEPNERAGNMRLVCKAAAALCPGPSHTTLRLSQPVPPHAFAHHWGQPGIMRSLTIEKRFKLLSLTAASGSIANLEFLLPRVGCLLTDEVLAAAAAAGQLAVCQWMRQQDCPWSGWAAEAAGQANRREVCEWLVAAGCPDAVSSAALGAARGGHVGLLEWLLPQGQPDGEELLACAAEGCDLPTLQRLHARLLGDGAVAAELGAGSETAPSRLRMIATAAGSPTPDWREKVEWLLAAGHVRCINACVRAACQPDALERLAWLRARGFPLYASAGWNMSWVERREQVEALEGVVAGWTLQGAALGMVLSSLASSVAQRGRLEVLRVLHERGHVGADCVHSAAVSGHLPVVAWAVEALGPAAVVMDESLFSHAAHSGSVELMAWLRERGCPWDDGAYFCAARSGCEEAMEWLAAQGCPIEGAGEAYTAAFDYGDLATLACLRRLGCPLETDTIGIFRRAVIADSPLPVLRWLVENGCPEDVGEALATAGASEAEPAVI